MAYIKIRFLFKNTIPYYIKFEHDKKTMGFFNLHGGKTFLHVIKLDGA